MAFYQSPRHYGVVVSATKNVAKSSVVIPSLSASINVIVNPFPASGGAATVTSTNVLCSAAGCRR